MPINSKLIQFFILIYPFFYAIPFIAFDVSYVFSIIYFAPLTLLFTFLNLGEKSLHILKKEKINLLLLFFVFIMVLMNTHEIRYVKPIFFIFFVINIYLLRLTIVFSENKKAIFFTSSLFLIFSLIFINDDSRYLEGERYFAFLSSPTVYSVYAEVFLILFLFFTKKRYVQIVYFLIVFLIAYYSKTRLNLMFLIILPFVIYLINKRKNYKQFLFLGFIICLNLLYPIYSIVVKSDFGKDTLVSSRYEDGRDASFGLRNHLNEITYKEYFQNSTLIEKLFGKGAEEARILVIKEVKVDIFTHNDFIRFTYDFGIICTVVFIVFLYRISFKNRVSYLLLLLYFFSFYHNSIYDFFIIALVIFYGGIKEEAYEISEN